MKKSEVQVDVFLLSEIRKGSSDAFKLIFKRYYLRLCAYALQYINKEDAEEVVQNAMLWLWENRNNLEINLSLQQYMFGMVKNKCITFIHQQKIKERIHTVIYNKLQLEMDDPDYYIVEELTEKINNALAKLPESYRQAIEMNRFQGKTYKEIALEENVSPKTIDYRIQQALKFLRIELKDYLPLLM